MARRRTAGCRACAGTASLLGGNISGRISNPELGHACSNMSHQEFSSEFDDTWCSSLAFVHGANAHIRPASAHHYSSIAFASDIGVVGGTWISNPARAAVGITLSAYVLPPSGIVPARSMLMLSYITPLSILLTPESQAQTQPQEDSTQSEPRYAQRDRSAPNFYRREIRFLTSNQIFAIRSTRTGNLHHLQKYLVI